MEEADRHDQPGAQINESPIELRLSFCPSSDAVAQNCADGHSTRKGDTLGIERGQGAEKGAEGIVSAIVGRTAESGEGSREEIVTEHPPRGGFPIRDTEVDLATGLTLRLVQCNGVVVNLEEDGGIGVGR